MIRSMLSFLFAARNVLLPIGLGALLFLVVVLLIGPGFGVLYQSPLATLGVALIGLGLGVEARRRGEVPLAPADVAAVKVQEH